MYKNERINEYTYKILDSYDEAMYLIIGHEKALLIDSGMEKENLYHYVLSITQKPVELALTHGHIDHIGRSGDFENVYMKNEDKAIYVAHMDMNVGHFTSDGLCFKNVDEIKDLPDQFDLGDVIIDVLPLGGHTPGSTIFIDQKQKTIFTGDAIGSGCGCWMQLDESLNIKDYQRNLQNVLFEFKKMNVDLDWKVYGGHDKQEYQSKVSHYNCLDLQLFKDMEQLCQRLIMQQVEFYKSDALKMSKQPYYVSYQKAEMIVTKEKIEDKHIKKYIFLFLSSLYFTFFIVRFFQLILKANISFWLIPILFLLILYLSRPVLHYLELKAVIYFHVLVVSLMLEILYFFLKEYTIILYLIPSGLLCIFIVCIIFCYGYYNIHHIVQKTYKIHSHKIDHLKIAVIADLHMGVSIDQEKLKAICHTISSKNVDIVVLDGDIFDENTTLDNMKAACQILGSIYNTKGIYYVYGNHDSNLYTSTPYYSALDIRNEFEKNHVVVLDDEIKTVDNITIIGRSDARFYNDSNRLSMKELYKEKTDNYIIVLDHQPLDLELNASLGCDLQISGHTHGGQLFPQGIIQSFLSDTLVYRKREIGDFVAITTSGISGWRYPIKTGAPSEYLIIEIHGDYPHIKSH